MGVFIAKMIAAGLFEEYCQNMKKYKTDENIKKEMDEEGVANFKKCDTNNDGRLDLAEYTNYVKLGSSQNKAKYGDWVDFTDDEIKDQFVVYDEFSPEPGISQEDLKKGKIIYNYLT